MKSNIFSVDPGTRSSGIALIEDGLVCNGSEMANEAVFDTICLWAASKYQPVVVIEDIALYSTRNGKETIATIKFIGVLEYRLKSAGISYALIQRWKVKEWAFDCYPDICLPRIMDTIKRKNHRKDDGELRKPSFVYVNDRVLIAVMKEHWDIETPRPGKRNKYGLSGHSWQALAAGTVYLANNHSSVSTL